jgi:hypothetical protein
VSDEECKIVWKVIDSAIWCETHTRLVAACEAENLRVRVKALVELVGEVLESENMGHPWGMSYEWRDKAQDALSGRDGGGQELRQEYCAEHSTVPLDRPAPEKCERCGGKGGWSELVPKTQMNYQWIDCPDCGGTGRHEESRGAEHQRASKGA